MSEEITNIQQEIKKLEHACKQNNLGCYIEHNSNIFIFKSKNYRILFIMTYLKHFDSYSLTIDNHKSDELFTSTWNLFATLPEMMHRIVTLIEVLTDKSIHYDQFK